MQDIQTTQSSAARGNPILGTPAELGDFAPVLKWLLVNCLVAIAIFGLWQFGLVQAVLVTDRTHVSLLIAAIFVLTALHCLFRSWETSRDLVAARRMRDAFLSARQPALQIAAGRVVLTSNDKGSLTFEPGVVASYVASLVRKAGMTEGRAFNQTVLLRALADRLRSREKLGLFVSEALLRLALLGTAIGFILMLVPMSQISSFDPDTLRTALTGMTSGMAIALNVTVTGIASALVLKFEYYLLDSAIAELFDLVTETTEVSIIPLLGQTEG